jgi:GTPase SAR1 family protein
MWNFIIKYICCKHKEIHTKIETEMQTNFDYILDDKEERKKYKILVLGETGVGKTAFIKALKEHISFQIPSFSETEYTTTKTKHTEFIEETNTNSIVCDSLFNFVQREMFDKYVAMFIMKSHFYNEESFFLIKKTDMIQSNILPDRNIGEIEMVEMPFNTRKINPNFVQKFDKIIIMGNYHDITTLRSIQYWIELVKLPANKIIICVNKCDLSPISTTNDFQPRKAKVLKHFFENYNLEFISVKTCANLTFLYKHL